MKHRKPPKPPAYHSALPGQCKYCGDYILDDKGKLRSRANWHPQCVETYKIIFWPQKTRQAVWKRDRGQCAWCPTRVAEDGWWAADHIKPLIEAKGDITYWHLENLQTLCGPCHEVKTVAENVERARLRREGLLPKTKRTRKAR